MRHLSIGVLHKFFIMFFVYFDIWLLYILYVYAINLLQCYCKATGAVLSSFQVEPCFYMPDLFIPLYSFYTV